MKLRYLSARLTSLLLAVCLICPLLSCGGGGDDKQTDAPTGTIAETPTAPATEAPTEPETEIEVETAPAGEFLSPLHLDNFSEEKNASYFTSAQSGRTWGGDGSLTLTASWKEGRNYNATVTIDYAGMMKDCLRGYTDTSCLANGGSDKYGAVIFTVEKSASAGNSDIAFTAGRERQFSAERTPIFEADSANGRRYLIFDLSDTGFCDAYCSKLRLTWSYGVGSADNADACMTLYAVDFFPAVSDALAAVGLSADSLTEDRGSRAIHTVGTVSDLMQPLFDSELIRNETVMFLDPGDEKALLYRIDQVISVTSYDGSTVYTEGVDYEVKDGKLVCLPGGSIPCITSAKYYNEVGSMLMVMHDGKQAPTHWGEGKLMTDWQVSVTYRHADKWDGFVQPSEAKVYDRLISKLESGEDVTVFFYGDSITYGASATYAYGYSPFQMTYPMLVTATLADLFGYRVHYISTGLTGTCHVPAEDYVGGDKGTITYVNTAVGGWTSADGASHYDTYIKPYIETYGCDLFIIGFGGNDASWTTETRLNMDSVCDRVAAVVPDVHLLLVATMVTNPLAVNGWYGKQPYQEQYLMQSAADYRRRGVSCACCRMTTTSLSILDKIEFRDYSGNNINHPNDFFARVYAQTVIQTIIGYGNIG